MSEIIAIDGPAGSGKSSVSRALARQLGFAYLDTGAAYRAFAWAVMQGLISMRQLREGDFARSFEYWIATDPAETWVRVGEQDVTEQIRLSPVTGYVSEIAALPAVRAHLVDLARQIAARVPQPAIVIEGRDITTVVAPEAKVRVLLTASEAARIKRRSGEITDSGSATAQVVGRDKADSQVVNFMTPAPGVELVDSTDFNFEQTVDAIREIVARRMPELVANGVADEGERQ